MPKKKKLSLDELKVQSFVTSVEKASIIGGDHLDTVNFPCGPTAEGCSDHCDPNTLIAEQCNTNQHPCGGTNDCTQLNCTVDLNTCVVPGETYGTCCIFAP
jgi:hypothetical protein